MVTYEDVKNSEDIKTYIQKADEALYLAKKQGKNQLAVYASGTDGRLQTQTGAAPF